MQTKHILLGILACSLAACSKFVDLAPISDATTENAYESASDAEAALVGAYDVFQQEYYIWDNINFSDVLSDNYYSGGDNPELFAVDLMNITPVNSRLFNNWSQIYTGISRANIILDKVPQITDPKLNENNRKEQVLGEAAFLRAYHYYQLVKMWGGVPLVLEPVTSADPAATNKPRATEAEVYAQIIKDLEFALTRLPDKFGDDASVNKARATKGAVNALLAKVYAQKSDRDYNKVLEYANAVISSPAGYQLINFNYLFDGSHYNNDESIMELQFTGGAEANWGPQLILPPSISGDSWRKFVTPSKDLVKAYDTEGDTVRKAATILFENVSWTDEFWAIGGGDVPFAWKWKSANGWASTNRQYIFRLADIMLLKAEALNELGRTAEAAAPLNDVRARVTLKPTTATTQAAMRLAIEKERRLELAQEGQRWDDLRRYGRAEAVMNGLQEIDLRTNQRVNYNMTKEKELLPIPQLERDRNKQLSQNPGYL
ncbi:RagB/SusD family nutrient uptake outer membrane protein [Chitinophaga agrisoli]|uniref:RagB/SusD family nutrient uptake outer membrane protein n=1 Tax=Chitinophaga agrisoli TaxID=2607653 RepID=A0A5B2VSY4_9BACT|nr:RagB/SusD family nutrient uptake outer membrane protein [Chitinophaga agrisoli]KAA2242913.1 RagB/SusD family nutrient uptake outer membrane protein [Chitinophaga agrisoli]